MTVGTFKYSATGLRESRIFAGSENEGLSLT